MLLGKFLVRLFVEGNKVQIEKDKCFLLSFLGKIKTLSEHLFERINNFFYVTHENMKKHDFYYDYENKWKIFFVPHSFVVGLVYNNTGTHLVEQKQHIAM